MPRPSGMYVRPSLRMRCAGLPVMSWPSKKTRPPDGGTRPETVRAKVLFPAPLAPSTASTDPGATSAETPKSACEVP